MANLLFSPMSLPVLTELKDRSQPRCGLCGLYKTCKSPKMPTSGKGKKKILILAEAPGRNEDEVGRQLVGESGQELERKLRSLGINMREDCWLENALICRPPNNVIKDGKAIEYCRPNLINRINELKPEVIIPLGAVSCESLIGWLWAPGVGGIGRWAGYQIPAQQINAWVCPAYHPSHILREKKDPVPELKWTEHLKAAVQLRGRPYAKAPQRAEERCKVVFKTAKAAKLLNGITGGLIAFDYETNCLKPDGPRARIHSCSVCYEGEWTIAFPWDGDVVPAMKRLLLNPKVKKIASNAKFEDRWTRKHLGIDIRGWVWDTLLAAHALENSTKTRPIGSIKFQAFVKLGQPNWGKELHRYLEANGGNTINRIKDCGVRELLLYNAMDSLMEFEVAQIQMREMGYV